MSHAISPDDLHATAEPYRISPFLLYTGNSGSVRANHVVAELSPGSDQVLIRGFGRGVLKSLTPDLVLSLLWPPHSNGDFSLIADAIGEVDPESDDTLILTVTGAVLHRPAPVDGNDSC